MTDHEINDGKFELKEISIIFWNMKGKGKGKESRIDECSITFLQ